MAIQIKDETASLLLLSIDNNGLICLGNGTPVSQLTIGGTAVIDIHGLITNQRIGASSLVATTGSITVAHNTVGIVNTIPGVRPVVQLEALWPAKSTLYNSQTRFCSFTMLYGVRVHTIQAVGVGSFTIANSTIPDPTGNCPTGMSDTVTYRWM